jgi:hypothetical protein
MVNQAVFDFDVSMHIASRVHMEKATDESVDNLFYLNLLE